MLAWENWKIYWSSQEVIALRSRKRVIFAEGMCTSSPAIFLLVQELMPCSIWFKWAQKNIKPWNFMHAVHLSTRLYLSIYLSILLPIYLSIYLNTCKFLGKQLIIFNKSAKIVQDLKYVENQCQTDNDLLLQENLD